MSGVVMGVLCCFWSCSAVVRGVVRGRGACPDGSACNCDDYPKLTPFKQAEKPYTAF
jgi:hypothetical protein